ncbi:MAG: cysteine hydrolase [Actinomycetes bacterium]
MPLDLPTLLEPAHTAIVMMELQRGVIGDLAMIPDLADEVRATGVLARVRALCDAARANGARVVHCTAEFRADRAGSKANAPMLRGAAGTDPHLVTGTPSAEVVPEIGVVDTDLVVPRYHGMSPFTGTQLDQLLRNCGVTTVIAAGVSLNIGIVGMTIEAVGLGYHVVLPTDAVAGVPREYGEQVIRHTLAPLTARLTTAQILEVWGA